MAALFLVSPRINRKMVQTLETGLLDLLFEEDGGWVIVDYKTVRRPESQAQDILDDYRAQIKTYADAWRTITGEPVREAGLFIIGPDWKGYRKYENIDL